MFNVLSPASTVSHKPDLLTLTLVTIDSDYFNILDCCMITRLSGKVVATFKCLALKVCKGLVVLLKPYIGRM